MPWLTNLAAKIQDYAPRCRFVEVFLDDEYQGVYLLVEKIKRDKNRVNVTKASDADVTGGYIFKLDKFNPFFDIGWESPHTPTGPVVFPNTYLFVYPKPESITTAQSEYLTQWFTNIENKICIT